jgi:chloramphenicol 3-O phosphotransferase
MTQGKIIFLNGPSSAGKTGIAKELQQLLEEPYLHVGVDMFYRMMPGRYFGVDPTKDDPAYIGFRWRTIQRGGETFYDLTPGPFGYRLLDGMQRAIAALASAGNNILIDENLIYEGQLEGYLKSLYDYEVLFVGVRCSLEEIEKRERQRGDRRPGHAKGHYLITHALVDANGTYDIEVDTNDRTSLECAEQISRQMRSNSPPTAFRRLHDVLLGVLSGQVQDDK